MSLESVKDHFKQWNREQDIMEFDTPSATVQQQLKRKKRVNFLKNNRCCTATIIFH